MPSYLYSYNQHSQGSRDLSAALGIRRLRHEGSTFRGAANKTVINWGASVLPANLVGSPVLNRPESIAIASDKLRFFQTVRAAGNVPRIPDFTTDAQEALRWVQEGMTVCVRTILRGSGAAGLIIVSRDNIEDFVQAPLYTKYVPKQDEYRVHVVRNNVIDTQRKALRNDVDRETVDWKIRNLANGFVFVRNENRPVPADVTAQAILAVAACGLDFGAVDVLYKQRDETAWVIEVNTAPGLMNTTLTNYANALRELI